MYHTVTLVNGVMTKLQYSIVVNGVGKQLLTKLDTAYVVYKYDPCSYGCGLWATGVMTHTTYA